MAVWKVDIEKFYLGEYWTNVYYVEAATLDDAALIGNDIVPIEESITNSAVLFTKFRTSDLTPGTDVFTTTIINEQGDIAESPAIMLALFNVVRFDLSVPVGRPGRKYIRGSLSEAGVAFNDVIPASITFYNDNYAVPLAALAGVVAKDGQEITSVTTYPKVGMRQLRRGSKRKALPVLP